MSPISSSRFATPVSSAAEECAGFGSRKCVWGAKLGHALKRRVGCVNSVPPANRRLWPLKDVCDLRTPHAQLPFVLLRICLRDADVGSSGGVRRRIRRCCFGGGTACPFRATARALTGARPASAA
jgi:hypothetical protein